MSAAPCWLHPIRLPRHARLMSPYPPISTYPFVCENAYYQQYHNNPGSTADHPGAVATTESGRSGGQLSARPRLVLLADTSRVVARGIGSKHEWRKYIRYIYMYLPHSINKGSPSKPHTHAESSCIAALYIIDIICSTLRGSVGSQAAALSSGPADAHDRTYVANTIPRSASVWPPAVVFNFDPTQWIEVRRLRRESAGSHGTQARSLTLSL